jgi:hypothetical protein
MPDDLCPGCGERTPANDSAHLYVPARSRTAVEYSLCGPCSKRVFTGRGQPVYERVELVLATAGGHA